ncbi:toll/interleukin-1 receptor domain-containing protein [Uliginosibacterium sp. H1]|uniref:toll/interleukin-1 receptor domain-containing protein n=1 Tax=Uliginosibacterium sp. H1 TaxID=3114757 RepID=UPI002E16BA3A|nr:toll/interleukin-1 receptor domain-containing protein [Uliginosibacterium sp. H1]
MSGIFISYRRADASGWAGRLRDTLSERFGVPHVFMDIETIRPGVDFAKAIDHAVSSSDVLLALIGPGWLQAQDSQGRRRLDDPDDFTRLEIATALRSQRVVIPVLLGGASMPARADLPEDIQGLARLQASEVSDKRWDYDVTQLLAVLEPLVRDGKHRRKPLLLGAAVAITAIAAGVGVWLAGDDGESVINPAPEVVAGTGSTPVPAPPPASTPAPAPRPAPQAEPAKPFPQFDESLARADAMVKEAQDWSGQAGKAARDAQASAERAAAAAERFTAQRPQHSGLRAARGVASAASGAANSAQTAAADAARASEQVPAQRQVVAASRDLASAQVALDAATQLAGAAKVSAGDAIRFALGARGRADDVEERLKAALAESADDCKDGFVWRQARAGDKVCVPAETRRAVMAQNRTAAQRWTNGPYGPQTCISGYVWREAFEGDTVCVKPEVRTQTKQDNTLAAQRRQ